ncbi:MAG: hypothetical protein JXJ04_02280 [Spirochaetales bacterium]|nr:hypothetical protein [Spirochaetales bacterium]
MVKRIIVIVLVIFSFTGCDFFFQTPFPNELIYWEDSIPVDGISPDNETMLYILDEKYVFLCVKQKDSNSKLYVFSQDPLKLTGEYNPGTSNPSFWCDTFTMKESHGYYYIGNQLFEVIEDGTPPITVISGSTFPEGSVGPLPPYGFGFYYNTFNYRVWWDDYNRTLSYCQYESATWGSTTSPELPYDSFYFNDYDNLEAVYYLGDPVDPRLGTVVLFFVKQDNDNWSTGVVSIPAADFESKLSVSYEVKELNSFTAEDTDPKHCYYTGDGYVIRDYNGSHKRFNLQGKLVKELSSGDDDYSEAYTFDGKTRFIFSRRFSRLMKTSVWW